VEIKAEDDNRMFPVSDSSETIINCFLQQADLLGIGIEIGQGVERLTKNNNLVTIITSSSKEYQARKVLIAVGGHPNSDAYSFIRELGHNIIPVIPSLFTFNDGDKKFKDLMGVAVSEAEVKIAGSDFSQTGPVLITHWGLSGPAVIKLSSWAAVFIHSVGYHFTALVNWSATHTEETLRNFLNLQRSENVKRKIINHPLSGIPQRLWDKILELAEISDSKVWGEASNKDINRLIEFVIRCPFQIRGKTTFKEEFVSCGGVDLKELNPETMESKIIPGVYFAGEVLNIDGETGGFNFQAAWTTAFVAASAI
jgi:predicted Rossmann fold flavoprotein